MGKGVQMGTTLPEMTLDAVRQQLSGIKGNLADTIIKSRREFYVFEKVILSGH